MKGFGERQACAKQVLWLPGLRECLLGVRKGHVQQHELVV